MEELIRLGTIGITPNPRITGQFFTNIEMNSMLKTMYRRLEEVHGRGNLNRKLGRMIKIKFNMKNSKNRENYPNSSLIQSYQIFQ